MAELNPVTEITPRPINRAAWLDALKDYPDQEGLREWLPYLEHGEDIAYGQDPPALSLIHI